MFCPSCGKVNPDNAPSCYACGQMLNQPRVVVQDGGWIPKNTYALWAYYLGIAATFSCILSGIPSLILGIMALKKAKENPMLKGQAHAWVGIILGGISVGVFIFFVIMAISASLS